MKGAVWTVDEIEFYKRRPQRCSGNSSNASGNATATTSVHNFSRSIDSNANYDKVTMAATTAAIGAAVFQSSQKAAAAAAAAAVAATSSTSLSSAVAAAAALHLKSAVGFQHHNSATSSLSSSVGYVKN